MCSCTFGQNEDIRQSCNPSAVRGFVLMHGRVEEAEELMIFKLCNQFNCRDKSLGMEFVEKQITN